MTLPLQGPAVVGESLTLYLGWLWYAARRRGFALDGDASDPLAEPALLEAAIQEVAPSLHVGPGELDIVRSEAKLQRYGSGEIVVAAGVMPDDMKFIVSGTAALAASTGDGLIEFGSARTGDCLGLTALTRERATVVATARDALTVLALPVATIDKLVRTRPQLAAETGASIELLRKMASDAKSATSRL